MLWMKTVFFLRREESFCSLHLIQFTISTAHSYPSSNSEWTCGKIMSSLVLQKWVKSLQFERLCPKLSRKCTMFCEVFWFNCCCQLVCSIVRISCVWVLHWYGYGKKKFLHRYNCGTLFRKGSQVNRLSLQICALVCFRGFSPQKTLLNSDQCQYLSNAHLPLP